MSHVSRLAALLAALCLASPAAAQPAARRPRVAILDVRALGIAAEKAQLLSEVALTEASSISGIEVIGRSDIQAMIGFEKEKQILGCAEDSKCMTEIAGAMGVDWILVGSLGQLDALYRLDLKLIDAKKSRIAARIGESIEGSQARLVTSTQAAVHKLLDPVAKGANGSAPVAVAVPAPAPDVTPKPAPPAAAKPVREAASSPAPTAAEERAAAAEAGAGRRWAVELRAGVSVLGGGNTEPASLKIKDLGEIDLGGAFRLNPRWSFFARMGALPSTQVKASVGGYDGTLELGGTVFVVGGAWAPAGNRYLSIGAEAGIAAMTATVTIGSAVTSQEKIGPLFGLELRFDYPLGERWYVGARTGAKIALVGFDANASFGGQTVKRQNDVTLVPLLLAVGLRL